MKAREIMTANPRTVSPDTNLPEVARLMKDEDVGMVPVVEDGGQNLLGVVTDRDITVRVVAEGRNPSEVRVSEVMSRGVTTGSAEDSVDQLMDVMGREQLRRLPIVDERGSLVGVVAQADLVRHARDDQKAERTVEQISEPSR